MPTTHDLAQELDTFCRAAADGLWRRFMPGFRIPSHLLGRPTFPGTRSALLRCLTALQGVGQRAVADRPILDLVAEELSRIRAEDCKTWWSLTVSDCLLALADRFVGNPALERCDEAQRREVAQACDTTRVVDRDSGELIGHPNNYWLVVLRCERNRLRLGLTEDRTVHDHALRGARQVLEGVTFMDDNEEGRGRYDVYAGHGVAACFELPDVLGDLAPTMARAWEQVLLSCAREDGGAIAWGRSGGHCPMVDLLSRGAEILVGGHASEPERLAGLCYRATRSLQTDWWADDALNFMRGRRPHWYFGPGRLIEMSANMLSACLETVRHLLGAPAISCTEDPVVLYPEQNHFIRFDARGPGVWCVRQGPLRFQLPLVDGFTSDYVAAPVWPGCFEQVCDRGFPAGVPVVEQAGKRWLPLRRPEQVEADERSLSWVTSCWTHMVDWDWWKGSEDRSGHRRVRVELREGMLHGEEEWVFDGVPDGLAMWFAESEAPLRVAWSCDADHQSQTIEVADMADWQSHTHQIRRLHQVNIEPAARIRLSWDLGLA